MASDNKYDSNEPIKDLNQYFDRKIENIELIVRNSNGIERIVYDLEYLTQLLQGHQSEFIDFPETGVSIKINLNYNNNFDIKKPRSNIIKAKVSIVGLNYSGKTSILQRRHLNRFIENTRPTIGMNAETFFIGNLWINAWDIGGQLQFRRALWFEYTKNSKALIYVIDLHDKRRLSSARDILKQVLEYDHIKGIPIAIFCNKIDLLDDTDEITSEDLTNILGLRQFKGNIKAFLTSAKTGAGILEAFYWVIDQIQTEFTKKRGYKLTIY